ncbi:hypothetical protein PCAR4_830111 [Paraburkholderia caribensis]|nr:hypothetical protein PCAR4_830111 [Paraburkholderia caribensis]
MGPEITDALAKLEARDLKIVWRKSIRQGSVEGPSARAARGTFGYAFLSSIEDIYAIP